MKSKYIENVDPEIAGAISKEMERQQMNLELIASENAVSPAIKEAIGSVLSNKYAEGYPGKRYYGGCEHVDVVETIARERAMKLFGADYANVQPHSGSQANMAAQFAMLEFGDTVLAMDLAHGGHLTHGSPASYSGKLFNFKHYGVSRETGKIDYDEILSLAQKYKPKMIIAGASAYSRILEFDKFSEIAKSVGAFLIVDMAHIAGLVAGGVHPNPVKYADIVTSTTHKTLRGPRGGLILGGKELSAKINKQIFPGIQGGPLMHVIAAKAICFKEASTDVYKVYQQNVLKNAKKMAELLINYGVNIVSGGTDNHLMLADVSSLGITGKVAEEALDKAGITVNKNAIPFDKEGTFITSGIRIGTPVVTTRGMGESEMIEIANLIVDILKNTKDEAVITATRKKVIELCEAFPLF